MQNFLAYIQAHPEKTNLIFDFDATLFLLDLPWQEYIDTIHQIVRDHDLVAYEKLIGLHQRADKIVNAFVKSHGSGILEKTVHYSKQFETQRLKGVTKNTELVKIVQRLAIDSRYSIFVWTSNCRVTVGPVLERAGLRPLIKRVVTKDDVQLTKPEPDGFALIEEYYHQHQLSVPPRESFLMTGDSEADRGAAEAVGIDFFLVDEVKWVKA